MKPKRMTMSRNPDAAQKKIAHDCKTTVLTLADCTLHHGTELISKLVRGLMNDSEARYDLLTVKNFKDLYASTLSVVASDIAAAVSLHNGERLVILGDASATSVASPLEAHLSAEIRQHLHINVAKLPEYALQRRVRLKGVIAACMDFRMHGSEGGLLAKTAETFGVDLAEYGLLATAGGAKELTSFDSTRLGFFKDNKPVFAEELILLSHTDCGKYGGNGAFDSEDAQRKRLIDDLGEAQRVLTTSCGFRRVGLGIVHLKDNKVARVEKVDAQP